MKPYRPVKRKFLFLQGPPGPFFWLLSNELTKRGHAVFRINFNGGDKADWPGKATNYRGSESGWGRFFDRYVRDNEITDILLFGDCRPLHKAAHGMAKLRDISIHVFEEGYIRPHWVTMEPDGVNGHSTLPRDPQVLLRQAATLPPMPRPVPITASFRRRMRDALRYYTAAVLRRWQYPFYKSHRPGSVILEGIGWVIKFARQRLNRAATERAVTRIIKADYFLFPLQLNSDYQIRTHSPFANMRDATLYVMESFATHAPANASLVIKEHPLDCEYRSWGGFVAKHARRLGIADRVIHIAGGDLNRMARDSHGIVTVNSTSGTLGLAAETPLVVLGSAIYNIPGITHQGKLDDFWVAPQRPDMKLYDAFRRVLHARCLISGGFASQSAIATLIESTLVRLFDDPAHIPMKVDMDQTYFDQAAAEALTSAVSAVGA
tara:strand:+ start:195910 stop:197214 length:1305 start_codon:yes stop_codon:yes gene_type:complete